MADLGSTVTPPSSAASSVLRVPSGQDRFGEFRDLGISTVDFKVSSQDSSSIFVIEIRLHTKGGPGRHLHYDQDEWFYVVQGEFLFEVGGERLTLKPGDSLYGPRKVPHVWAFVGEGIGRILFTFTPPAQAEAFFREITKANGLPPTDPEVFRRYGMELLGPPLKIE